MPDNRSGYDGHFQSEMRNARRLFFGLLPFTGAPFLLSGAVSGEEFVNAAEYTISSVSGFFGGGTR